MHLFKSQDEQNTPEYSGQDSGVFAQTRKGPDLRTGGDRIKLNLSVIEETSENTLAGQSVLPCYVQGDTRENRDIGLVQEQDLNFVRSLDKKINPILTKEEAGPAKISNKFSFGFKPISFC